MGLHGLHIKILVVIGRFYEAPEAEEISDCWVGAQFSRGVLPGTRRVAVGKAADGYGTHFKTHGTHKFQQLFRTNMMKETTWH